MYIIMSAFFETDMSAYIMKRNIKKRIRKLRRDAYVLRTTHRLRIYLHNKICSVDPEDNEKNTQIYEGLQSQADGVWELFLQVYKGYDGVEGDVYITGFPDSSELYDFLDYTANYLERMLNEKNDGS